MTSSDFDCPRGPFVGYFKKYSLVAPRTNFLQFLRFRLIDPPPVRARDYRARKAPTCDRTGRTDLSRRTWAWDTAAETWDSCPWA